MLFLVSVFTFPSYHIYATCLSAFCQSYQSSLTLVCHINYQFVEDGWRQSFSAYFCFIWVVCFLDIGRYLIKWHGLQEISIFPMPSSEHVGEDHIMIFWKGPSKFYLSSSREIYGLFGMTRSRKYFKITHPEDKCSVEFNQTQIHIYISGRWGFAQKSKLWTRLEKLREYLDHYHSQIMSLLLRLDAIQVFILTAFAFNNGAWNLNYYMRFTIMFN